MTKKEKKIERTTKIKEAAEFAFSYKENAERLAIAFIMGGYFVLMRTENGTFVVRVYVEI